LLSFFIILGEKGQIVFHRLGIETKPLPQTSIFVGTSQKQPNDAFVRFSSEEDAKNYIINSQSSISGGFGLGGGPVTADAVSAPEAQTSGLGGATEGKTAISTTTPTADRVSDTNVQVLGVDEPDIVKTDGSNIYLSKQSYIYYFGGGIKPMMEGASFAPGGYYPKEETQIINAFPPENLAQIGKIDKQGNMLLSDKNLVILGSDKLYGYDVSDPKNPKDAWSLKFDERSYISQARLYQGRVYLVMQSNLNYQNPCPITPIYLKDGKSLIVPCTEIYHPKDAVGASTTYSVLSVDPKTGDVSAKISFLGSYDSQVYMSQNAIYVAYSYTEDQVKFASSFASENSDIFPAYFVTKLQKLQSYDISQGAKMTELYYLINELRSSMSQDDSLKFENDMKNRMASYMEVHKREVQKTDIVKVNISDFQVAGVGSVPGMLLNQFSMDEYQNNLRVATTIGRNFWGPLMTAPIEEANDLYVLSQNMTPLGSVLNMGRGEQIYSVRFIGDNGYIVTFKQVDPFFVLDLKDPKNPKIEGELKIPGYSAYLHPMGNNMILGVGREDSNVKLSLFDVSDPKNPQEISKYTLNEYWSDILNTHKAFLLDKDHEVFFIPGSQGGYVFSYKNNQLKLQKAVSNINAQRALYLDNYLYIIGNTSIVVVSEDTWDRVNSLDLK